MSDEEREREPGTFQVTAYRCRCGHEWVNRDLKNIERPRVCPRCKSANWDRPYKFRRTGAGRVAEEDLSGSLFDSR